ncbi:HlyD family secretion protein [Frigidibacter sp. ROC022]|uniref:HlyD family secretion protein n=1 Tax=Frigidibacter sp. ROC022 TaxID=2971796 RepID=UPI00215AA2FD|nr:HlyD family efflux transporter periplasmic adaptor subunit [Frigidibacter sp. ROC022]MCR8726150.1 HlyD family efflux transporter periplasmic adaptor subunit [Frigidibacter sp. ROC022]
MSALVCSIPLLSALFTSCLPPLPYASGYVEGEYVLVAPVATAQITRLLVDRGDRVAAGEPLVDMERRDAVIALASAEAALAQAEANLANLLEGARPEEIKAIEASLTSAKAQADEAARTAERNRSLAERGVITATQRDDAQTAAEVARAKVAEIEANLAAAQLPARPQLIAAARAALDGARAARDKARWNLDQRQLSAATPGTIFDIIRSPGELAGPSAPVLSMLPDGAVKLRLYVPEDVVSEIHPGSRLSVHCDGCQPGLTATVNYVSDAPEFTPPVIYSLENRQKLVFLIEARPDSDSGALKPGQIVDVDLADLPETPAE